MSIDTSTVRRIANLSRIEVADADLPPLVAELNTILAFVEELSAVNTDGVKPMTSVVEASLPLRADVVTDGGYQERVLQNAPNAEHGFFTVPKVIE